MSKKRHKRIGKPTEPKPNVTIGNVQLSDLVYIDFAKYPHWTDTVQVGKFNNCLKNKDEALRHFFFIVDQLIPDIEDYGKDIFNGRADHCHCLGGEHERLARKVIKEIYGDKVLDDLSEIWELSGKTNEIRIIGSFVNSTMHIFYPLFIDHHHLIYPDKHYNSPDYGKYGFTKAKIVNAGKQIANN